MKRSELKSGMLIKRMDGKLGVVMLNTPQGDSIVCGMTDDTSIETWFPMDCLAEDLSKHREDCYDISEVWGYSSNSEAFRLITQGRNLLWKHDFGNTVFALSDEITATFRKDRRHVNFTVNRAGVYSMDKSEVRRTMKRIKILQDIGPQLQAAKLKDVLDMETNVFFQYRHIQIGCKTIDLDKLHELVDRLYS